MYLYTIHALIFIVSLVQINAQATAKVTIQPSGKDYHSLGIDATGRLLIMADRAAASLYDGHSFIISDLQVDRLYPSDSLGIGPISDQSVFLRAPIYASMTQGLWIEKAAGLRKFTPSASSFPENIFSIHVANGDQLFILTTDSRLYLWDNTKYDLNAIDISKLPYIKDITTDDWGQLWLLSDQEIHRMPILGGIYVPIIRISDIQSSFASLPRPWSDLRFDSEEMVLTVKTSTIDLRGAPLSYQYSLQPGQWSAPSESSTVNLTNLAAGRYELQMRSSIDQINYGYSDIIPFVVSESLWNGYLLYTAIGLVAFSLLWIFSLLNYNRQINKLNTTSQQLRLQNQLLHEEQRTQQLQMNPHFIFNILNTIQGVIASDEPAKARKMINSYAQMMRSLLDQSRADAITLENEIKFNKHYLSLEKIARNHKFDFQIMIDEDVNQELLIPPMIIQPILENAIVHGMKGIQHTGLIKLTIKKTKNYLNVTVDDNGVGRSKASIGEHKSHGISILQKRLQSYSKLRKENHLIIIDKVNEKNEPAGTQVTAKLPIL